MKLTKESKIGITVVLAIAFLYWGIHYLRGINLLQPNNSYYTSYTNASGLAKSAPVSLDGFQVGVVEDLRYDFNHPGHITVKITLDKHLQLPEGTKAILTPALLGSTGITLQLGNGSTIIAKGDTLESGFENGLMEMLNDGLLPDIQVAIKRLNNVLAQVENQLGDSGELHHTIYRLSETSDYLRSVTYNIDKVVRNDVPPLISNINTISNDLAVISNNLSSVDFAASMGKVDGCLLSVQGLLEKINSDNGTVGLLLNDTSVYFNINRTIEDADKLLVDLKTYPKRYVHFSLFGRKKE